MAKIAIDAGHGLYSSGKRCMKSLDPNQTREWVLNNRVAVELAILLESAGHETLRVDDPTGKIDRSLEARVKKANDWGADFFISVHHNAGINGGKGGGLEVYVVRQPSATSVKAQNAIYKHCIARTNHKGNRYDGTPVANFYVIRYTKMPACLIECGYMDSAVDIKLILDPEWSKKMALGIAEGICEIYGGKINTVKKETVKNETTKKETSKKVKKPEKLKLDGEWGKLTTKASQYVLETGSDGIVSSQPTTVKKYLLTISDKSWEFVESKNSKGSILIKAIQKLTDVPEEERDGKFGKDSIKYMQKFLKKRGFYSGLISGKLNKATTIAWQKYINKQMGY